MADAPLVTREEAELARLRARLARLEGAARAAIRELEENGGLLYRDCEYLAGLLGEGP